MKTCKKCGIEKPLSEFHKHKNRKDGVQTHCKSCAIAGRIDYYKRNSDKEKKYDKDRVARIRLWIQEYKSKLGCNKCGDKRHYVLDFHHLQDKDDCIGNMANSFGIVSLQKEIDKCIVLCSNCHRELHYMRE